MKTVTSAHVTPRNSVVVVADPGNPDARRCPDLGDGIAAGNAPCSTVGTHPEGDGQTEIHLGWRTEVAPDSVLACDGQLNTLTGRMSVKNVPAVEIMSMGVTRSSIRVFVWVNDQLAPSVAKVEVE